MKRASLIFSLLPLVLASCGSSDPLPKGDGTYAIDETVSNEGGSLSYEIFVRSFYDADGDGIGDFDGILAKADYLKQLGVGNIWLLPIFPSPSYHGYDTSNFYKTNADYGSLNSFKAMVKGLKEKGVRVTLDIALNHCSPRISWFQESYNDFLNGDTSPESKADWFIWSTTKKSGYAQWGDLYYECSDFNTSSMADFNWDSKTLREELKDVLLYWMNMGIAGFRLDAVRYFYEGSTSKNVAVLRELYEAVAKEYPDVYFVGENWTTGSDYYDYFASGIPSFFQFATSISATTGTTIISAAKGYSTGDSFVATVAESEKKVKEKNPKGYSSYFISNHDQDRSSKSLEGDDAKFAASITYLLPGTPYIYYGEEIGLLGVRGAEPTDVMRRLPMIWSETDKTGECSFPEKSNLYLMSEMEQVKKGALDLLKEPMSLTNHYRKLGQVRNKIPWIKDAAIKAIETGTERFFAYTLTGEGHSVLVVHNGSEEIASLDVSNASPVSILDSIDTSNFRPKLEGGSITLGGRSTAVMTIS